MLFDWQEALTLAFQLKVPSVVVVKKKKKADIELFTPFFIGCVVQPDLPQLHVNGHHTNQTVAQAWLPWEKWLVNQWPYV